MKSQIVIGAVLALAVCAGQNLNAANRQPRPRPDLGPTSVHSSLIVEKVRSKILTILALRGAKVDQAEPTLIVANDQVQQAGIWTAAWFPRFVFLIEEDQLGSRVSITVKAPHATVQTYRTPRMKEIELEMGYELQTAEPKSYGRLP